MLHEAGHGIYEQGLDRTAFGTPIGDAASLGIHESQSRMWENFVGRSQAFWKHFYPQAQTTFPEALGSVSRDDFYAAVNNVEPSFIRVEADEVTYNLHIMIRFELEQQLISGKLQPADVPAAWNDQYTQSLGITPSNDAEGCLQDIHWSGGGLGLLPDVRAGQHVRGPIVRDGAQGRSAISTRSLPRESSCRCEIGSNDNVHRLGRQYLPERLIEKITGKPLSHEPLVAHLKAKFEPLYGL